MKSIRWEENGGKENMWRCVGWAKEVVKLELSKLPEMANAMAHRKSGGTKKPSMKAAKELLPRQPEE
jgi:hypothetical protein